MTVLPDRLIRRLGFIPASRVWTRGYDGTYTRQLVYFTALIVEGFSLPAIECIATDRADVLLGRNVLSRFVITLDGKNLTFAIQDP